MHDEEFGLDHANGLDAIDAESNQADVDDEDDVTPEEEEAALNRLMEDGFDEVDEI